MRTPHSMPRLAAFWPYTPTRLDDLVRWSELAAAGPYERLWLGQSAVVDTAGAVAYAAGAGRRCPLGLAVQVIPMHNPVTAAQQIRGMATASGAEVRVCFSVGDPVAQTAFTGQRFRSPLTATREFLTVLRALLDGAPLQQRGDYYSFAAQVPAPEPDHPVRLGLGTLRPRMAALAGEIADTAVTWLTPPSYVRDVLVPALTQGAASAGRAAPELVVPVHAALAAPDRDPRTIAEAALGSHLRTSHYREMLAGAGESRVLRSGVDGALESGLLTYGSVDDIADRVAEAAASGADEIPLVLHQPQRRWPAVREEWLAVGAAVTARLSATRDRDDDAAHPRRSGTPDQTDTPDQTGIPDQAGGGPPRARLEVPV